jgi:hypothetical protein
MLTQSSIASSYNEKPYTSIGWDGDPGLVAAAKRAWFRLAIAYHVGGSPDIEATQAALRELFADQGLSPKQAEVAIVAARELERLAQQN